MMGCSGSPGAGSGGNPPADNPLFERVSPQVVRAEFKVFSGNLPPKAAPVVVIDVTDPGKARSIYEETLNLGPPPSYPPGSIVNCPNDTGSNFGYAFFGAGGSEIASASIHPTGCSGGTLELTDGTSKDVWPDSATAYWYVVAKDVGMSEAKLLTLGEEINGKIVK
jgi:hypothetical protein